MPVWLSGEHHGKRIHHCVAGDTCTIGRGTGNDLVLPSQTVSRNHARLRVTNGAVLVTDLEHDAALERLVESLSQVITYAEQRGVVLGFEPEPGMYIETMQQGLSLVNEDASTPVDHTNHHLVFWPRLALDSLRQFGLDTLVMGLANGF